jgi:hypothetical protein
MKDEMKAVNNQFKGAQMVGMRKQKSVKIPSNLTYQKEDTSKEREELKSKDKRHGCQALTFPIISKQ